MSMCEITRFTIGGKKLDEIGEVDGFVITSIGCSLLDLSLEMNFLQPNKFTFTLRPNAFKDGKKNALIIVENLIGKEVKCEVETTLTNPQPNVTSKSTLRFTGTVAKVSIAGMNLTCVAYSPDADLQGQPKCRCFSNSTLQQIFNEVTLEIPTINVGIHGVFDNLVFPYIVQYNESDYDFLARLAKRFGAFFYYDHKADQLVFGKLASPAVKEIQSPNVASVSYELQTDDANFKFITHYDNKSMDLQSQGYAFSSLLSKQLFNKAVGGSKDLERDYSFYIDNPYCLPEDPADDVMDNYNSMMLISNTGKMVICKFTCFLLDVQPGDIVKINDNGNLVVTSAHLSWDCNGSPQNEITAMMLYDSTIGLEDIVAPYMDINAYPKSSAQRAVVVNNVDPKKMGRVQVRFVWQTDPNADPNNFLWIRIAQPYGGNQKGSYILPEIGEEVMVGFEHENMEKPYVIGALFHDSDKDDQKQMPDESWVETDKANKENEVKAFRTKKGHTIEFHDTKDGDGFIRIYGNNKKDKENYDIILSTDKIQKANGNQKEDFQFISADEQAEADQDIKEKKDYKAEKLRIMVRSNGGDIMLDAGEGDIIMNAKNIRVNATGNTTSFVKGKNIVKVEGAQLVDVGSNSLMVQKDQQVHIKGADNEKYDKTILVNVLKDVKLEAKSLDLKTDQKTEVKAGTIAANANQDIEMNANGSAKMTANSGITIDGGSKVKMEAMTITIDGMGTTTISSPNTTVKGTTTLSIQTPTGTRSGIWTDK